MSKEDRKKAEKIAELKKKIAFETKVYEHRTRIIGRDAIKRTGYRDALNQLEYELFQLTKHPNQVWVPKDD